MSALIFSVSDYTYCCNGGYFTTITSVLAYPLFISLMLTSLNSQLIFVLTFLPSEKVFTFMYC